jgi:hypothetical protein
VIGEPLGALNTRLLEMLTAYDLIYVAEQAKSHCVPETATTLHHCLANDSPEKISH